MIGQALKLDAPQLGAGFQCRRGIGRAAADARGDRQVFLEGDGGAGGDVVIFCQQARGAQDKIVWRIAQRCAERPGDGQRQCVGGFDRDDVADAREDHQGVEQVIAVGPLAADVQAEVDFSGRGKGDRRHSRNLTTER